MLNKLGWKRKQPRTMEKVALWDWVTCQNRKVSSLGPKQGVEAQLRERGSTSRDWSRTFWCLRWKMWRAPPRAVTNIAGNKIIWQFVPSNALYPIAGCVRWVASLCPNREVSPNLMFTPTCALFWHARCFIICAPLFVGSGKLWRNCFPILGKESTCHVDLWCFAWS